MRRAAGMDPSSRGGGVMDLNGSGISSGVGSVESVEFESDLHEESDRMSLHVVPLPVSSQPIDDVASDNSDGGTNDRGTNALSSPNATQHGDETSRRHDHHRPDEWSDE